jgi:thiol-disulfide isomerase/thioredoxin
MTASAAAVAADTNASSSSVRFERLWRLGGVASVVAFALSGVQPGILASREALRAYYVGNEFLLLIAVALSGVGIVGLLWFAAAIRAWSRRWACLAGRRGWRTSASGRPTASIPPSSGRSSAWSGCWPPAASSQVHLQLATGSDAHAWAIGKGGPGMSDSATANPPRRTGLLSSIAHRLAGEDVELPVEGHLAPFSGATGWLNSTPLTPEGLRGRVVLVDFWTYTCINWLRTLPYLREWHARYADKGLTIVGAHTPEFDFEHDVDNIVKQSAALGVTWPIAIDSNYGVWRAFANHFWPAVYLADAEGRIRFHQFGEGEYAMTEMVIQQLLEDAGATDIAQGFAAVDPRGLEVSAEFRSLRTPETYLGYAQASGFAAPDGLREDRSHAYGEPTRLSLNTWSPIGQWTITDKAAVGDAAGGRIAFRFQGRDVNLVMGPTVKGTPIRFRVSLDGQPATGSHGTDVGPDGSGTVVDQKTYQLIRQPGLISERTFEIEFVDPGIQALCFTFG